MGETPNGKDTIRVGIAAIITLVMIICVTALTVYGIDQRVCGEATVITVVLVLVGGRDAAIKLIEKIGLPTPQPEAKPLLRKEPEKGVKAWLVTYVTKTLLLPIR